MDFGHPASILVVFLFFITFNINTFIVSLENLSGDGLMWRSGLSGNGSTININYSTTLKTTLLQ